MVKPLDLLKFSQHVYDTSAYKLPPGWYEYSDSDKLGFKATGYHGLTYINYSTKEIVIASGGSNKGDRSLKYLLSDLMSDYEILQGKLPAQFTNGALPYTKTTFKSIGSDLNNYKIYFTGHSLGAVLAETSKVYFDTHSHLTSTATTFDSPGSLPLLKFIDPTLTAPVYGITIYNGSPNLINTCNSQAGKVWQLYDNVDKSSLAAIEGDFGTLKSLVALAKHTDYLHKLDNMSTVFNPKTGFPENAKLIEKWPVTAETTKHQIYKIYDSLSSTAKVVTKIYDNLWNEIETTSGDVATQTHLFDFFEGVINFTNEAGSLFDSVSSSITHLGLCKLSGKDSEFCHD